MSEINFNNKTFVLVANSANGKVDSQTVFKYQQQGHLVTADYFGGSIQYGKIIAILKEHQLQMLYQCLTSKGELMSGKAAAEVSMVGVKMKLKLHWEWLGDKNEKGISEYIEVNE